MRTDKPVQSLRMSQAKEVLEAWGLAQSSYNYIESSDGQAQAIQHSLPTAVFDPAVAPFMRLLARSVHALSGGVKRAHLVPAYSGSFLQELYTTDGAGMLICRDLYDGIRSAREEDLVALHAIIKPLEEQGVLAPRSREDLLAELSNTFVMVRDNATVACGMLKQFDPTHAEIACLAVHPNYRLGGRGETMLTYLEHRAVLQQITNIFILSTHTMQWFEERGFRSADPSVLPPTRKYNHTRNSKVYIKKLGSQRDLEAENLLWDIA
ncbi:GNAT family N-acetyltransferase [archaeon]|nr:MAG: GNAT family N-acetyltransferase [archaeon]